MNKARKKFIITLAILLSLQCMFYNNILARAATSESSFSLRISAASVEEPTPTPTPTPAGVPGFAQPGLVVSPYFEEDIFVSGEDQVRNYVRVMVVSGVTVIPDQWFQTMSREPEFLGKTNLKNAIVYLSLDNADEKVYTTFANIQGAWKFATPQILPFGVHTLYITAMSPVNPYFKAVRAFQFEVIPIPVIKEPEIFETPTPVPTPTITPTPILAPTPAPIATPTPEHIFIPPTPQKPIPKPASSLSFSPSPLPVASPSPMIEKTLDGKYGLNVEVMPQSKKILAGEELNIKTKIINSIEEANREVLVRFIIKDPRGNIVYDKTEKYIVNGEFEFDQNILLSPSIKEGKYTVTQEIVDNGITYSTSDYFEIGTSTPGAGAGILATIKNLRGDDLKPCIIVFLFIFFFLILYIREYVRSKRRIPINDEDVYDDGQIR
ncbi:MAG: Cellobiohydrolase A (1,4-beta-cellobiosidase A) [Parcubacteria group bacterium GW2011_GWA2_38_13]|nr:MAG: Cellobiohydrolase A (1,4-beta-cellobiosidase A) [Parcubacteria group bacterium GW2011_GWA2_38_13]